MLDQGSLRLTIFAPWATRFPPFAFGGIILSRTLINYLVILIAGIVFRLISSSVFEFTRTTITARVRSSRSARLVPFANTYRDRTRRSFTPLRFYKFQLMFVSGGQAEDDPITGLNSAECYWLEIAPDLGDIIQGTETCYWNWLYPILSSPAGNQFSMQGSATSGYHAGSERDRDLT